MLSPPPPWAGLGSGMREALAASSGGRRFAALSTLPAGRRLPPKRDVIPARHQREATPVNPVPKAELALPPSPVVPPVAAPVMLPSATDRQLGFNCPACFAVLIIKDPVTYDGRPAPCPTCGMRILPPQCVPDSPFSIVHRPVVPETPEWARLSG